MYYFYVFVSVIDAAQYRTPVRNDAPATEEAVVTLQSNQGMHKLKFRLEL